MRRTSWWTQLISRSTRLRALSSSISTIFEGRPAERALGLWCSDVGEWTLVGVQPVQGKANMAGKDKGGRSTKTPAAKTAKEKRRSKKDKKAAKSSTGLVP